jgi:hypothetical protein
MPKKLRATSGLDDLRECAFSVSSRPQDIQQPMTASHAGCPCVTVPLEVDEPNCIAKCSLFSHPFLLVRKGIGFATSISMW